jgi:hypothetical protein
VASPLPPIAEVISRFDEVRRGEWLPKVAMGGSLLQARDVSKPQLLQGISSARPEGLEHPTS